MANFAITKERVEVCPHSDDTLALVKAGNRVYVLPKDLYKTGDEVIHIPDKSILPPNLAAKFERYLFAGVLISLVEALNYVPGKKLDLLSIEYGVDVSKLFGIKEVHS
jgi:hypothetical protein